MPFTLRPYRRFPVWSLGVLLALLTPSPAAAVSEYHGLVVRVLDGDTLEVLHNRHPERIRLNGIDCPEKGQDYSKKAKPATAASS
jgi:micrococcal nuclease